MNKTIGRKVKDVEFIARQSLIKYFYEITKYSYNDILKNHPDWLELPITHIYYIEMHNELVRVLVIGGQDFI